MTKTMTISIDDCREGDVVSKCILSAEQDKLIDKDTVLTDYIIKRLKESYIERLEVYSPCMAMKNKTFKKKQFVGKYNSDVSSVKSIICNVAAGRKIEAANVNSISDSMYQNFNSLSYSDIFKYMNNLRNQDEYTYFHSVNVAFYSMMMARWLKLSVDETKKVIQAGFLHDVGKARVPIEILNKPGKLTNSEFSVMKQHTLYGFQILEESNFSDAQIKQAVLMHHERVNGTGYPFKAPPAKIGLIARIVSIADVYDAMTSDRVYKKAKTPFDAFRMFMTDGYADFDVHITEKFVSNMSISLVGANVKLSDGNSGKIIFVPPDNQLNPVVETKGQIIPLYSNGLTIAEML